MNDNPISEATIDAILHDENSCVAATITIGGTTYSASEFAKCADGDRPDPQLGAKLAAGRALRQLGRDILGDANREVRRNAEEQARQNRASAAAKRRRQARARKVKAELENGKDLKV